MALIAIVLNISTLFVLTYIAVLPLFNTAVGFKYGEMAMRGGVVKKLDEPKLYIFVMVANFVVIGFCVYFIVKEVI